MNGQKCTACNEYTDEALLSLSPPLHFGGDMKEQNTCRCKETQVVHALGSSGSVLARQMCFAGANRKPELDKTQHSCRLCHQQKISDIRTNNVSMDWPCNLWKLGLLSSNSSSPRTTASLLPLRSTMPSLPLLVDTVLFSDNVLFAPLRWQCPLCQQHPL
jgi:hypothetical protein